MKIAAFLVIIEHAPAGAGRRKQYRVSWLRLGYRGPESVLKSVFKDVVMETMSLAAGRDLFPGSADQHQLFDLCSEFQDPVIEFGTFIISAAQQHRRPRHRADSLDGSVGIRSLGIIIIADAADLFHELDPVGNCFEHADRVQDHRHRHIHGSCGRDGRQDIFIIALPHQVDFICFQQRFLFSVRREIQDAVPEEIAILQCTRA